mgnify:CR=1 FL=1
MLPNGVSPSTIKFSESVPNLLKKEGYPSEEKIGIETKKQFILWRDCGSHAELLGLIQKEGLIEA